VVNEHILVTIPERSESALSLRIYSTVDIDQHQPENLVQRIQDAVDSDSWNAVGGPNGVSLLKEQWLVVSAYRHTHCELSDWLSQQRGNATERTRPTWHSIANRQGSGSLPQFAANPIPEDPLLVDVIHKHLLCGSSQLAIGHTIPFGPWSFRRARPQSTPLPYQPDMPEGVDPFASPVPTIPANGSTSEPDLVAPTERDPFADP
jgi:hypothetical protein